MRLKDIQLPYLMPFIIALQSFSVESAAARETVNYEPKSAAEILNKLLDSPVCQQMPHLPSCRNNNSIETDEGENRGLKFGAGLEVGTESPLLTMALDYIAATQEQNKELVEREREHVSLIAKLELEKVQLENQVTALEEEWIPTIGRNRQTKGPRGPPSQLTAAQPTSASLGADYRPNASFLRPVDCSDHLLLGAQKNGVYEIYPFKCRCSEPVKVWCDMETDGGGWTVILLRQNSSNLINFSRSWSEYRDGFGDASNEYWIGNEILHIMTNTRGYTLRLDFQQKDGTIRWAEWQKITVSDGDSKYKLDVPQFDSRSMTDNCLAHHNGRYFSTYDYDTDGIAATNCAQVKQGGWWYNNCATLDPTIPYNSEGLMRTACTYKENGKNVLLEGPRLHLKMRPVICSQLVKAVYFNSHTCEGHNGL